MISPARLAGLLAVALCAIAVSAASASAAAPEFKHNICTKSEKAKDTYPTEAACKKNEKAGEEPREWDGTSTAVAESSSIKFTDKSKLSTLKVTSPKITIECQKSTSSGEITGPKTVKAVVVHYTECKESTVKCHSLPTPSGGEEEIVTNSLIGELKNATTPEETLSPEAGATEKFTEIKCGTVTGVVKGSVSGVASPVEKLEPKGKLTFTEATGLTFASSASTLTSTDELEFPEAIEVTK